MEEVKKTCLYDLHVAHGGSIVEFGGFLMPIEYKGITPEHQAVRANVGLFDVSHMGEVLVTGKDTCKFLDFLVTSDITNAKCNHMTYGLLLYPNGTVVDDLMLYKFDNEKVLIICNASNTDKDFLWMKQNKFKFNVSIDDLSDSYGELALQGPNAIKVMEDLVGEEINNLKMMDFGYFKFKNGFNLLVSRSGYTGEDGFEIYGSNSQTVELFKIFADDLNITLCGLGCRDTLRFEASMPLYGHEINDDINPVEAGLNYALCFDKDFIGKGALLNYKENPKRKLVGIELIDRGIARGGYEVCDLATEEVIGYITTGYLVPDSLKRQTDKPIALAYVDIKHAQTGTNVGIKIRKNVIKAVVRDKKFMVKNYVK